MTSQQYTPKFLIRKGLAYCKQIAKEIGVVPQAGDKRELFTWVDAIISYQESKLQKVEVQQIATIKRDERDRYVISVEGEEFGSFSTLRQAEYSISRNPAWIFEPSVAEMELEPTAEVEPVAVEATVEIETEPTVEATVESDERGSGRAQEFVYITNEGWVHPYGWVHTIRFKSHLILGEVYLDTGNGYTLNGEKFFASWKDLIDTFLGDYTPYAENEQGISEFLYITNQGYKCAHGWVHFLKFKSSHQIIGEIYLDIRGYTLDGETFYPSWKDPAESLLADYYLLEEFR